MFFICGYASSKLLEFSFGVVIFLFVLFQQTIATKETFVFSIYIPVSFEDLITSGARNFYINTVFRI